MRTLPDEHPEDFEDKMLLGVKCWHCKKDYEVEVSEREWKRWKDGELIQRAMPGLSDDDRELLISHTCPSCWNDLFGEEE